MPPVLISLAVNRWRVRTRMIVIAIVLLAPAMLATTLLLERSLSESVSLTKYDATKTNDHLITRLNELITDMQTTVEVIAQSEELASGDPTRIRALLDLMQRSHPFVNSIFTSDRNGYVQWSTASVPDAFPLTGKSSVPSLRRNIAWQPYFLRATTTGMATVSEQVDDPITGRPTFVVAKTTRSATRTPNGLVGLSVSYTYLDSLLAPLASRGTTAAILIDRSGAVEWASPGAPLKPGDVAPFREPLIRSLLGEEGIASQHIESAGSTWLVAFAPLRTAPLVAYSFVQRDRSLAIAQQPRFRALLYAVAAVGMVLLVSVIVVWVVVKPFPALLDAVNDFGSGNFERRVQLTAGAPEFHTLATGFNSMATLLQQRNGELEHERQELRVTTNRLRGLLAETWRIQEDERKRISIELHDGANQTLIGALYEVEAAYGLMLTDSQMARDCLNRAKARLREVESDVYAMIFDLRPPSFETVGLTAALANLVQQYQRTSSQPEAVLEIRGDETRLKWNIELGVYRVVQEALRNVAYHSQGARVKVVISFSPDVLFVRVQDWGKGFDPTILHGHPTEHLGLSGMLERIRDMGGSGKVQSAPGEGTAIEFTLNLRRGVGRPTPANQRQSSGRRSRSA